MRNKFLILSLALFGLMFLQPAEAKPKHHPQGTYVVSVNPSADTITLKVKVSGQVITYKVGAGASFTIDGSPATLNKVHNGMRVSGYTEGDEHVLISLDIEKS